MSSVLSAQNCLQHLIKTKKIFKLNSKKQDNDNEIRYSRNKEFNDLKIKKYLKIKNLNLQNVFKKNHRLKDYLVNPFYFKNKD